MIPRVSALGLVAVCLIATGSASAESVAPRFGTPLWIDAEALARILPGALGDPTAPERGVLAEALAEGALEAAARELTRHDLPALARSLAQARWGDPAALSPVEASGLLAGYAAPVAPLSAYPPPLDPAGYRAYLLRAGTDLTATLGDQSLDRSSLASWFQRLVANLPRAGARAESNLPKVLGSLDFEAARALVLEPPDFEPAWRRYRHRAWCRRAAMEILTGRLRVREDDLNDRYKSLVRKFSGRVQPGKGEAVAGLLVNLAGGRLGTATTDDAGKFAFTVPLREVARLVRGSGDIALQVVQDRREVFRRVLAGADLMAQVSHDLGTLALAPARGSLQVRVPAWATLQVPQDGDEAPGTATARVVEVPKPATLDAAGEAYFAGLSPGPLLVSVAVKDAAGSLTLRSFAVASVAAAKTSTASLALPVGATPSPKKRKTAKAVAKDMKALAKLYRSGSIPYRGFRQAVGQLYRLHHAVSGDPKKDKLFAREVAKGMGAAFAAARPPPPGPGSPEAQLVTLGQTLQDLRAILPAEFQGKLPAGVLADKVRTAQQALGGGGVRGEFLSVVHRRTELARAESAADELAGVASLLVDVLGPKVAAARQKFAAVAQTFADDQAAFRLDGRDLDEALMGFSAEHFGPLEALVAAAARLVREGTAQAMRRRVEQIRAQVEAAAGRLRARGAALEAAKSAALAAPLEPDRLPLPTTYKQLVRRLTESEAAPAVVPEVLKQLQAEQPHEDVVSLLKSLGANFERVALRIVGAAHRRLVAEFDDALRRQLDEVFERQTEGARLRELAQLDPAERRRAVSEGTTGLYLAQALEKPAEAELSQEALARAQSWVGQAWVAATKEAAARQSWARAAEEKLPVLDPLRPRECREQLATWLQDAEAAAGGWVWHRGRLPAKLRERFRALEAEVAAFQPVSVSASVEATSVLPTTPTTTTTAPRLVLPDSSEPASAPTTSP